MLVLVVGIAAVGWPYLADRTLGFDDPRELRTSTTTVAKSSAAGPSQTTTVVTTAAGATTTTRVTKRAGTNTEKTTTVGPAADSLFERALAGSGLLFLQLGLVFVAAFLAGGIVQRVWVGSFGIKLPFVELSDLPAAATASKEAIDEIKLGLNEQIESLTGKLNERLERQTDTSATLLEALAGLSREVAGLDERLERLES